MEFRSFADLHASIVAALPAIPRDLDLIVGIPRSGMLPANLLALHLNVPFTDLDGFLEGRVIATGRRPVRALPGAGDRPAVPRVLVIDDCLMHGTQMRAARDRIARAGVDCEVLYAAVYVTPESLPLVDVAFEELPPGYCFEWNVMHHPMLTSTCVDIDGVLCVDPSPAEDDEGLAYAQFLREAKPLFLPTIEIGWLVTGRLAKYRGETEAWLRRHNIRYRELVMVDLPDVAAKEAAGGAARFKAEVYARTGAALFLESNPNEAAIIAARSGRPVLCVTTQRMVYPGLADRLPGLLRRAPRSLVSRLWEQVDTWSRRRRNRQFIRQAAGPRAAVRVPEADAARWRVASRSNE